MGSRLYGFRLRASGGVWGGGFGGAPSRRVHAFRESGQGREGSGLRLLVSLTEFNLT